MTAPSTLKAKTAELKRNHVLQAAMRVFSEKGFRGATIKDVAIAAGVADGTIYNLFENKAALLSAILESGPDTPAPAPHAANGELDLRAMLAARWAAIDGDSLAMLRVVLAEALVDPDFRRQYRDALLRPAIQGLEIPLAALVGKSSAGIDARLVTGLFMGLVMLRLLDDDGLGSGGEGLDDRIADFALRGLTHDLCKDPQA